MLNKHQHAKGRVWADNPEFADEITMWWKKGLSAGQIVVKLSNRVKLSRNAVVGKLQRLGLTRYEKGGGTNNGGKYDAVQKKVNDKRIRLHIKPEILPTLPCDDLTDLAPEEVATPVSLLDVLPHQCRWPVSNGSGPFLFCGATIVDEGNMKYCPMHRSRAISKPQGRSPSEQTKYVKWFSRFR